MVQVFEVHVDKRVAKYFEVKDNNGDNIFRGKVAKVNEDEGNGPYFLIESDDNNKEDVEIDKLLGE